MIFPDVFPDVFPELPPPKLCANLNVSITQSPCTATVGGYKPACRISPAIFKVPRPHVSMRPRR